MKFTKVFYATDVHGSEVCFRKFLGATQAYNAEVLILGGDLTGKFVYPIVDMNDGSAKVSYLGKEEVLTTPEAITKWEQLITDSGYYYYHCNKAEYEELQSSKDKLDKVFLKVMQDRLIKWAKYADEILPPKVSLYVTGGNDDFQEIMDAFPETGRVKNCDNKVVKIDDLHEMASAGWSNMTPWKCPRDITEEELEKHVEKLMESVTDRANCVFNFHCPPIDCGLDTVQKLDASVDPPRPVMDHGQPVMVGAGSKSVRAAIEKYQPLVDLCGHIHESRGVCKIKKTLVVNPGSEYTEGILRGVIVNLGDKKVVSWQLISG
ncbi:MAG: metallophosphoesterase [Candidatus Bathyarchaeia archaeon]